MNDLRVLSVTTRRRSSDPYDLNVLALFHCRGQYRSRIEWFKLLGLVNRRGRRVHVTAVCSEGDHRSLDNVTRGWPRDIDVSAIEMGSTHPLPKLNGAYLWLRDHPIPANWLLRVDDDSVTDVDGLLTRQEQRFGRLPVHIMTSPNAVPADDQTSQAFREYCTARGFSLYSYQTEYEASLTSGSAFRRIIESAAARDFLWATGKKLNAPSDKSLAIAARIAGVPTAEGEGLTHRFCSDQMSLAGGRFEHIHYVDWTDERFSEMLWAFEYGAPHPIPAHVERIVQEKTVEFGRCVGHMLGRLTLSADHRLLGSQHPYEGYWRVTDGRLLFESESGQLTTVFDTLLAGRQQSWLTGPCMTAVQRHYLAIG